MCRRNAVAAAIKCVVFWLLSASVAQAAVYRWVDERGQVHFSDKPHKQAEVLELKPQGNHGWQPLDIRVTQEGRLASSAQQLDLARIKREVNEVYRFYDQVMYFDFYRQVPVNIHLLADQQEYMAFVQRISGYSAANSLGVYLPKTHEIAVFIHDDASGGIESTYKTIRHEASHAILHSLAQILPDWLNEGMAEQMETLRYGAEGFSISRHDNNRRALIAREKNAMDVLTFIEVRSDDWRNANHQHGVNQQMAGQLVYMLLSTSYGRSLITRLLQDYKRGVNKRAFYLLDEHYIGGAQALKIHWENWLKSGMVAPADIRLQ
ncbi:MAG: DUF4124 domain-containing protein [Saccharospirillaceae bacterium]|nr:DUF4124 domain-containing protein [Saccharospirillaceae bacterium]MCD8529866.1 DUF4124 domain-containing protein [Saccharospirillaceae bacterium]